MHSDALPDDEVAQTKATLEWPQEPTFHVPEDVQAFTRQAIARGKSLESQDEELWQAYAGAHPEAAAELKRALDGELPTGWEEALPTFEAGDSQATRNASGTTLNALAPVIPNLIGGSADLAPSNKTLISGSPDFQPDSYAGRNFRFGVREHGMGGILNGMALHGGVIPYGGTFLVFSDYMRPSIRLAALMGVRVVFIFTHDSVGVGEDGPTHQPVEQAAALRAIPNLTVFRPGDANEVAQAWKAALENQDGPTALLLTRQSVPVFDRSADGIAPAKDTAKGGYLFYESAPDSPPDLILVSCGSELEIAFNAARQLAEDGSSVRVVSLPCWSLFSAQSDAYQAEVLPPDVPKVSIEAGVTQGWHRWVGNDPSRGIAIGVDRFGASAPYKDVYKHLGLTPERVVEAARSLLRA